MRDGSEGHGWSEDQHFKLDEEGSDVDSSSDGKS